MNDKDKLKIEGIISVTIVLSVIIAFILYIWFDVFDFRDINKIHTSEFSVWEIIETYDDYKDSVYDYSDEILKSDIDIWGTFVVETVEVDENSENKYCIKSKDLYLLVEDTKPRKIAFWVSEDESSIQVEKIKKGDKIEFFGKINSLNDTFIIVNKGGIIND